MEILALADRFQNNIELSTTICNLYFIERKEYGKKCFGYQDYSSNEKGV